MFKRFKYKRIIRNLLDYFVGKGMVITVNILEKSRYADEVYRKADTLDRAERLWGSHALIYSYGIHMSDHYSRNYLNEADRTKLITMLLEQLPFDLLIHIGRTVPKEQKITAADLRNQVTVIMQTMGQFIPTLETYSLIVTDDPENRDNLGLSSLHRVSAFLMAAFCLEEDQLRLNPNTWEGVDEELVELFDTCRKELWYFHQDYLIKIEEAYEEEGFKKVRDIGTAL